MSRNVAQEGVRERNDVGQNKLHLAILEGDLQAVKQLLQEGSDVNAVDDNKDSCLHLALSCEEGPQSMQIFKMLLERNPNLNAQNLQGDTPSHIAFQRDKVEALGLLLSRNANIYIVNGFDESVVDVATEDGEDRAGYDMVNDLQKEHTQLKHFVENFAKEPILSLLRDTDIINAPLDEQGNNALLMAAKFATSVDRKRYYADHVNLILFLLDNGADLYSINLRGESIFDIVSNALNFSQEALEEEMKKAPIPRETLEGEAAEVLEEKIKALKEEIESFTALKDVLKEEIENRKALKDALKRDDVEAVKEMFGREITAKTIIDGRGNTPLHLAAIFNASKSASFLVDRGVSPLQGRNKKFQNPYETIKVYADENKEVAQIFAEEKEALKSANYKLIKSIKNANKLIIDDIIARRSYCEVLDNKGNNALHIAAQYAVQSHPDRTDSDNSQTLYLIEKFLLAEKLREKSRLLHIKECDARVKEMRSLYEELLQERANKTEEEFGQMKAGIIEVGRLAIAEQEAALRVKKYDFIKELQKTNNEGLTPRDLAKRSGSLVLVEIIDSACKHGAISRPAEARQEEPSASARGFVAKRAKSEAAERTISSE